MRILALDCSAKSVSVCIAENENLLFESFLNISLTHSETLMPMCEQALKNTRLTLNDIDALAITAGPGSFTGVRIGISAIKGICFGAEKPVFAYSTLDAMALAFDGNGFEGIICGVMDARREQFYNALFEIRNGKLSRLCDDRIITYDLLEAELTKLNEKIVLVGDGAEFFNSLIKANNNVCLAPKSFLVQRAGGIALNASGNNCIINSISANALKPTYLRKSQAEREREAKLK